MKAAWAFFESQHDWEDMKAHAAFTQAYIERSSKKVRGRGVFPSIELKTLSDLSSYTLDKSIR